MTVHEASNGHHDEVAQEKAVENGHSKEESSSCFFEWELLPHHRIDDATFQCELCHEEIHGPEVKLKLHQISLHVNPFYLSASDRILAQISSYAIQTDKTEGPWVPDWETFKGLYRCHECFLVFNEGKELLVHLASHQQQQQPLEQPNEDLEDEPLVKRMKSPKSNSPKKCKDENSASDLNESPKKRKANDEDEEEDIPLAKKFKSPEQETPNDLKSSRPDRKCKSTTNTLVAMLTADERYYDLELKKSDNLPTSKPTSSSKEVASNLASEAVKVQQKKKISKKSKKKRKKLVLAQKKKKSAKKKPSKVQRPMSSSSTTPKPSRRSTVMEMERVSLAVTSITDQERSFRCLSCHEAFVSYHDLAKHKAETHAKKTLLMTKSKQITAINSYKAEKDEDLRKYVAEAVVQVPEVTFNNMHGTIKHIESIEGQLFREKEGQLGAVEKVKLNLSEYWNKVDVWESGWEQGNKSLNWRKYDQDQQRCLFKMSQWSWAEQGGYKEAFDNLKIPTSSNPASKEPSKRNLIVQGLNLKQLGKSVKYMTINERETKMKQMKAVERKAKKAKVDPQGVLNGEWENPHDFMCSTCAIVYDELREILHHKWEAHPYCLVAHVTIRRDLNLPPSNLIHPQLGRSLTNQAMVKTIGRKSSPLKRKSITVQSVSLESEWKCSKCTENNVFETKEAFYVHVLECGGDVDWDVSKKKKKKKRNMNLKRTNSTENNEEAAQRRKARFERFNRPPPLAVRNGGRMTRLQADIIKKERKVKRKNPKKTKKTVPKKPQNPSEAPKKASGRRIVQRLSSSGVERTRRSTAFYGFSTVKSSPVKAEENMEVKEDSEVRKIVLEIMDLMLNRVEKAAQVLDEAEKLNLDLDKAKEELVRRRASTDSNSSLKVSIDQEEAEEIIDIVQHTQDEAKEPAIDNEPEKEPTIDKEPEKEISEDNDDKPLKRRRSSLGGRLKSERKYVQEEEKEPEIASEMEAEKEIPKEYNDKPLKSPPKKRRSSFAASFYLARPKPDKKHVQEEQKEPETTSEKEAEKKNPEKNDDKPLKSPPKERSSSFAASLARPKPDKKHVQEEQKEPEIASESEKEAEKENPEENDEQPLKSPLKKRRSSFAASFYSARLKPEQKSESENKPEGGGLEEETEQEHFEGNDDKPSPLKKRRSSFAASFYSARPKSDRLLRRSNGRVNYFEEEDIKGIVEEPEEEESSSPIRRKKPATILAVKEPSSITFEDATDFSSGDEQRPRRQMNNNLLLDSASFSSRVVFPVEVKACAIQRIRDGETQVQVARDLQCPVSTVASWWHRRASIVPELASEAISDSAASSATESEPSETSVERKKLIRSPKKKKKKKSLNLNRNVLLSQMKERVEAAFAAHEEDDKIEQKLDLEVVSEDKSPQEVVTEEQEVSSSMDETEVNQEQESKIIEEEEEEEEKEIPCANSPPKVDEEPLENTDKGEQKPEILPSSEESSNDGAETSNMKLKNAILRTCFASLHRRQKLEKEQEYHQYLNGFD